MRSRFASTVLVLSIVVLAAASIVSCGSVTGPSDGGAAGAAGTGAGGTGAGGNAGGTGGAGGAPLTCRTDVMGDCPAGFTCACGGPGPGVCTCHRNCSDTSQCPVAEPMCGCPSTVGGARFCVNACFCNCQ